MLFFTLCLYLKCSDKCGFRKMWFCLLTILGYVSHPCCWVGIARSPLGQAVQWLLGGGVFCLCHVCSELTKHPSTKLRTRTFKVSSTLFWPCLERLVAWPLMCKRTMSFISFQSQDHTGTLKKTDWGTRLPTHSLFPVQTEIHFVIYQPLPPNCSASNSEKGGIILESLVGLLFQWPSFHFLIWSPRY